MLVLAGVTFVTLSDRSGNTGVFGRARVYARDIANPFTSAVHSALQPVGNFLYGATHYQQLERQNDYLRQQLAEGQALSAQAQAVQTQGQQALAQARLDFVGNIKTVAAQVVDLGSANFEQTIEVNRGTSSGVAVGEPVVTAGGLVGKVTSASSRLATVTLLDDPVSVVGVRSLRSGTLGALGGSGKGNPLHLNDVDVGSPLRRGDKLVTSGLQLEDYPPGIPVGTVTHVSAPSGALQLSVEVHPFADLDDLELVQVLLWSPQTG